MKKNAIPRFEQVKIEHRVVSKQKALPGNSGLSRFHRGVQIKRILIKFSVFCANSRKKHSIGTSKEDMKLVVMGKPGFENREDSILRKTS